MVRNGTFILLSVMILTGCGSSPDDPPIMPPAVVWTGDMEITGELDTGVEIIRPDSIGLIISDDTLGFRSNPCTIDSLMEGNYTVSCFFLLDFITYTSPMRLVRVTYGQVAEVELRLTRADLRGCICVSAVSDNQTFDSVTVKLDGVDLGWGDNPRLISDVTEGLHRLFVASIIGDDDWETSLRDVAVTANDTTSETADLIKIAPTVGEHAPDLECVDIDDSTHYLSDHWGEVIYLYFFEHT